MAYGKSNGHVTNDVTWPWKVKVMTSIRLGPSISKTAGDRYYIVCCEAVRSAIIATAWLLVTRAYNCRLTVLLLHSLTSVLHLVLTVVDTL